MPLNKNQLVFCTDGIHPELTGGMQRHSRLLIEALVQNYPMQIIVVHPHIGKKLFEGNSQIIEIEIPFKSKGNYLLNCYNYSKLVFEAILPYSNCLVYSQGLCVWYRVAEFKNRLIVNPHGLEPWQGLTFRDWLTTAPFRIIENKIFKNSTFVVSLGGKLSGILQTMIPQQKIAVLHNAVNIPPAFERDFNHTPLKVLYVGRFVRNKGIEHFIEMAEQLNREGFSQKVVYFLAGTGTLFDLFKSMIKSPNIYLTGFADDKKLKELYSECDFFVFPSVIEGLPTVVLEAMSYSMPVVACDTGATSELIDNTNGFLIEKGNALQLKNAVKRLFFMDDAHKQDLSRASYQRASANFSWQKIAAEHHNLFSKFW